MTKPLNILFLMTDQLRADYTGWDAQARLSTPNLERIASGIAFSNAITVSPMCTPARSALLTGKYPHQIGLLDTIGDLSLQHPTYLRALQDHGYYTAGVGKFHWLQGWPLLPIPRGSGFDLVSLRERIKQFGLDYIWETTGEELVGRNYCDYTDHLKQRNLLDPYWDFIRRASNWSPIPLEDRYPVNVWPFDEQDHVDVLTGDKILEALDQRPQGQPFFLFGSFCAPHPPYDPPARYLDSEPMDTTDDFIEGNLLTLRAKQNLHRLRRSYRAMVRLVDDQIGRVLNYLEASNLLESTVILFTSDHGEMLGDHGLLDKGVPYQQSVRVPCAIHHPHYLGLPQNTAPFEITDLTATILEIAGIDPSSALSKNFPAFNNRVPSRSLMPILRGETPRVREFVFSEMSAEWSMIQTASSKYIRYHDSSSPDHPHEAYYNLIADPQECSNLVDDPSLKAEIDWHRRRLQFILETTPPAQQTWAPIGW
ncbi:MAG TPA: sulfatase-like hydrolase/transferase [Anaerolineaceae bacterium]